MTGKFTVVAAFIFALITQLGAPAQAEDSKVPYPAMAPVEQYLMDHDAEIALARSAAPESISGDAKILVLGRHGYETAAEGKNGFVCFVDRAWSSKSDQPEFWNPKIRAAACFNPQAVRSVLPIHYMRAQLALAGQSKEEMDARVKAAYQKKELPPLEPGAMAFMMSKQAYLTDQGSHNMAHLMFYTPLMDGRNWGAGLPKSPVYLLQQFQAPEPINVFIVATGKWSDSTPAPVM